MKTEPPLLILLFLFLAMPKIGLCPYQIPPENYEMVLCQRNSLLPLSMTQLSSETATYGSLVSPLGVKDDIFEDLRYRTLIKCLARYESSMGLLRTGDHGQSRGLLHYYRWWESDSLWGEWCVGKYGFDDIDNDRQQVLCADWMLQEDFNLFWRWTTAKYCY